MFFLGNITILIGDSYNNRIITIIRVLMRTGCVARTFFLGYCHLGVYIAAIAPVYRCSVSVINAYISKMGGDGAIVGATFKIVTVVVCVSKPPSSSFTSTLTV